MHCSGAVLLRAFDLVVVTPSRISIDLVSMVVIVKEYMQSTASTRVSDAQAVDL
jgi:hypothetical protein